MLSLSASLAKLSLPSVPALAAYSVAAVFSILTVLYVCLYRIREWRTPFKNLSGPPSAHIFFGNIKEAFQVESGLLHRAWTKQFGPTFRYHLLFGETRICTSDPVSLNFILSHSDMLYKPALTRKILSDMLGSGVLVAEAADHRRQRRVLNPCFSLQSIKDVMPVFYDKAEELREKLLGLVEDDPLSIAAPTPTLEGDAVLGGRKIDVLKFLSLATIDIIGIAGFDYDFKALSQPENELAKAFSNMFLLGQSFDAAGLLQALIPGANRLPTKRNKLMSAARATTQRIGRSLLEEKKWAIGQAHAGGLGKHDKVGKDLLSSCVRANVAADLKPEHRLSDDEVLAQITTFMLAGNETSSTALTWILYLLSLYPETQTRLREECLAMCERPSMEEMSVMPYLAAVVHEGLRLISPVQGAVREAGVDVVLPLGTPVKGKDGQMMDHVKVSKGTSIFIPIHIINTSKDVWGPDAEIFNPSRHLPTAEGGSSEELRAKQHTVPGTFGSIMTFLGGPRNCIGYRFAIAEIKVILFVLLRGLEFEELESKPKIERKNALIMRPRVIGEEDAGPQMPLIVKAVVRA